MVDPPERRIHRDLSYKESHVAGERAEVPGLPALQTSKASKGTKREGCYGPSSFLWPNAGPASFLGLCVCVEPGPRCFSLPHPYPLARVGPWGSPGGRMLKVWPSVLSDGSSTPPGLSRPHRLCECQGNGPFQWRLTQEPSKEWSRTHVHKSIEVRKNSPGSQCFQCRKVCTWRLRTGL